MFARTERLLLRPGWIEDAPALAEAIGHGCISGNLGWGRWPSGKEDAERWLRQTRDRMLPRLLVLSRTDSEPDLVGGVGLHRLADDSVELDFWTNLDRRRRGFATEAGKAMLNIAQILGLRHIAASVFSEDSAAARVLEKLGFTDSGAILRPSHDRHALTPARRYERGLAAPTAIAMPRLAA